MERTKVISVVNDTAKAPKNQEFLEKCCHLCQPADAGQTTYI